MDMDSTQPSRDAREDVSADASQGEGAILPRLQSPHQLKRLSGPELKLLAREIRERVIEVVSQRGGHLASNLGIAELTLALHHVFDFSRDRLLWDVGHQCYPHKLITGRASRFDSLRQQGGLSGFPAPSESEYDLFATGHAGTAIATATGLAWADHAAGRDTRVVAVVGDASITNGLSFEALNYAALLERQFLIVLNDNSMAIDRNPGAMAAMLDRVRMTHTYADLKHSAEHLLRNIPLGDEIAEALRNVRDGLRTTIHGDKFFEPLGLKYFGPFDGHDLTGLIDSLGKISKLDRPALLHVHTTKGKGCQYAVEDPCRFHSPSAYEIRQGKAYFPPKERPSWTKVFAESLLEQARDDERVVGITAAMPDGTGLVDLREAFPERYIDVGISESQAVAMAGGLAKAGQKPVVAIYSTFLQRAFDQVFHELALQKLPAIVCMDRAGLVGSDGAVHHGTMDLAFLRAIPGLVLAAPADAEEMRRVLRFALACDAPVAIRYPRDEAPASLVDRCPPFELGKSLRLRAGEDVHLLCYGATCEAALRAAETLADEGIAASVTNARFAKPLDAAAVAGLIRTGKPVLTIEDHARIGGFGSAVLELAASRGLDASGVHVLGVPDRFIAHATRAQQLAEVGLDAEGIAASARQAIESRVGAVGPLR
jgi:1-deoxy-D-xylulose-5-phosphate synthase